MNKIKDFLLNNISILGDAVRELNGYDGSFEHLDVYENDEEFFNMFFEGKPMEAVRASQYGNYNYTDDYVRFNGYGNLESLSEYKYEDELKSEIDDIVDTLLDSYHDIYLNSELEELIQDADESNE